MRDVVLDTSFLVKCAEYHIDFVREIERVCVFPYRLCAIDKTNDEFARVEIQGGKERQYVRLARKFMEKLHLIRTEGGGMVDDHIVEYLASHDGSVVATVDKELVKRARAKGASAIIVRQQKYLMFMDARLSP